MEKKRLLDKILGSEDEVPLEHRILSAAVIYALLSIIPAILTHIYVDRLGVALVLVVYAGLYAGSYYAIQKKKKFELGVFLFSTAVITSTNIFWLLTRGIDGPTVFYIFAVMPLIVFSTKRPVIYTVAIIANLVGLILLDDVFWQYVSYQLPMIEQSDSLSALFALVFLGTICIFFRLRMYSRVEATAREKAIFEHMALHDYLTQLPNRKYLMQAMLAAMARTRRNNKMMGLMMVDLNGFKAINDEFGHDAGDTVLCHMAEQFKQCIRANDFVARLGGDEFAFVFEDVSREGMQILSDKVLAAAAVPVNYQGRDLQVTGSIGATAFCPEEKAEDDDAEALIMKADKLMYKAKVDRLGCCFDNFLSMGRALSI